VVYEVNDWIKYTVKTSPKYPCVFEWLKTTDEGWEMWEEVRRLWYEREKDGITEEEQERMYDLSQKLEWKLEGSPFCVDIQMDGEHLRLIFNCERGKVEIITDTDTLNSP
jgi:hypothetical protein